MEDGAEDAEALGVAYRSEVNLVGLLDLVDEVRVDDDAVGVADDQERRVLQRLAVLEELLVGRVEVGSRALVLSVDGRDE